MTLHTLAIIFAPGCALVLAWALTGIGSHRTRQQPHERSQQVNCEGRGVVGRVHNGSDT